MKRNKVLIIIFLLATVFSIDLMAIKPINSKPKRPGHGSVGAPLDGGLLAVVGAAGIAYYASRKKKNDSEK